jgi:hypothetical protein
MTGNTSVILERENRTRRPAQYGFGHTASHDVRDAATAVCAHDDQIGVDGSHGF